MWTIESIPVFCITLARRDDRWKRFQDQSAIRQLPVKKFLGVDGKTIDLKTDSRVTTLTKRNIRTKSRRSHEELDSIGGVGCALSHLALWQWMISHQTPLCLVFEDDAFVPPDFIKKANMCIQQSPILQDPSKWDLWLLGGIWEDLTEIPSGKPIPLSLKMEYDTVRIGSFMTTHCYVMTLHGAQRYAAEILPIHAHIDMWMSIFTFMNNMRIVGCPSLCIPQNPKSTTDIQSEEGCAICNVPTDFKTKYELIPHWQWRFAQASEAVLLLFIMYHAYRFIKKA